MNINCEKSNLRKEFLEKRNSLAEDFKMEASKKICREIRSFECLSASKYLAAYRHSGAEPDLDSYLAEEAENGKALFFPKYNRNLGQYEMAKADKFPEGFGKGKFGIQEPVGNSETATDDEIREMTWLVPGVAFDKNGDRLGHGNGVYDRLLKKGDGLKIGVCFNVQITKNIPLEDYDIMMDYIICEEGIIKCKKNGG